MNGPWIEVDLEALERNIRSVRACLKETTSLVFVVKANAYGHGAVPVARKAAACGVNWFAVAYLREALEIRRELGQVNIVVIGHTEAENVPLLIEHRIIPVILNAEHAHTMGAAAAQCGRPLAVHLKIDTGMGRLGIPWFNVADCAPELFQERFLDIQGICTHFATIDPNRPGRAQTQIRRFQDAHDALAQISGKTFFRHVSSSRAMQLHGEWDFEGVRPGIVLYGYGAKDPALRFTTEPILQWKTRVMQVKTVPEKFSVGYYNTYITQAPTDIVTISVGYADGFQRHLGNKGHVLIRGRRCPVVGRVSMNWITADAGLNSGIQTGDEVVLLGRQGGAAIWADEMSRQCQTIPYEILTGLNAQIEHRYLG